MRGGGNTESWREGWERKEGDKETEKKKEMGGEEKEEEEEGKRE